VGAWPNDLAIAKITKITVFTGEVIDSVRITYKLTNGQSTEIIHGGNGGKVAKDMPISLNGNFYFVLEHSDLFTPLELQMIKNSLPFMVAGSMILKVILSSERKSRCPRLFSSLYFKLV